MKIIKNEKTKNEDEDEESKDESEESKDEDEDKYEYEWAKIHSSTRCLVNAQVIKANPNIYLFCQVIFKLNLWLRFI